MVHFPLLCSFTIVYAVADFFGISVDFSASATCNSYIFIQNFWDPTPSHSHLPPASVERPGACDRKWMPASPDFPSPDIHVVQWSFYVVGVSVCNKSLKYLVFQVLSWHLLQRLSFQHHNHYTIALQESTIRHRAGQNPAQIIVKTL